MLNKLLQNWDKITVVGLVLLGFSFIRTFEKEWFYDPLLLYFKSDFKNLPFPKLNSYHLFFSMLLRFFINTVLSLVLIYTLFKELEIIRFSVFMYFVFMVLLFSMFFIILCCYNDGGWLLFYVRRFIIQPIMVMLFIPAFYYQRQQYKK